VIACRGNAKTMDLMQKVASLLCKKLLLVLHKAKLTLLLFTLIVKSGIVYLNEVSDNDDTFDNDEVLVESDGYVEITTVVDGDDETIQRTAIKKVNNKR